MSSTTRHRRGRSRALVHGAQAKIQPVSSAQDKLTVEPPVEWEPPAIAVTKPTYLLPDSGGARHIPHYQDTHEDYVLVSRNDLKELSTWSWLQEGTGAAGMMIMGTAAALLFTILVEHGDELVKYMAWLAVCGVLFTASAILLFTSHLLSKLKRSRIEKLFEGGASSVGKMDH